MRSLLFFLGLTLIAVAQSSQLGSSSASAKSGLTNLVYGLLNWIAGGEGKWFATIAGVLMLGCALVLKNTAKRTARSKAD